VRKEALHPVCTRLRSRRLLSVHIRQILGGKYLVQSKFKFVNTARVWIVCRRLIAPSDYISRLGTGAIVGQYIIIEKLLSFNVV